MKASKKLVESVTNVANQFEANTTVNYLGCKIRITYKQEPFKFVNGAGNMRTKSARYDGYVDFPNGERVTFEKMRGGAVARLCGVYVREEHEKKTEAEKNGSVWECARKYYREHKND